ncbi:hypothetical protein RHIZ_09445 [Rhizobium skierniewicense]|uniref:hypothetical protein n=1 Tax=Rhizobium skierniewicense TaxID=984260 RepID=UPI001FACEE2A|nr:hypothetical protein [Rhizobium skierniewicense]MCI9866165.1 hypothetical protein [Rhizobium skierniewicense]
MDETQFGHLAAIYPAGAILRAFEDIERFFAHIIPDVPAGISSITATALLANARKQQLISKEIEDAFRKINDLRNSAVHFKKTYLPQDALEFREKAASLLQDILPFEDELRATADALKVISIQSYKDPEELEYHEDRDYRIYILPKGRVRITHFLYEDAECRSVGEFRAFSTREHLDKMISKNVISDMVALGAAP